MLTRAQYEVASELLEKAADKFASHISNDYELPMEPEFVELLNEYERWNVRNTVNKVPEHEHTFDPAKRLIHHDSALMSFLAAKLEEESTNFEQSNAAAESIDSLIPQMDRDLDELRKKWAQYAKNPDGTEDQGRVVNVLVAAHVATKKFGMIAEHYARPVFNGNRNGWRQIERSIEEAVEAWLKRPADGSLGLRRVK